MEKNYIYISIPKSGGTYARNTIVQQNNNMESYGHTRCMSHEFMLTKMKSDYHKSREWFYPDTRIKEGFDEAVKFSIIRNPFDLLSSYFVSRWGDYDQGMAVKLPNDTFDGLVRSFCENPDWHVPFFREFLYFQLFDEGGNSRCDYVIIYDKLEEGLSKFAEMNNLNYKSKGRLNVTQNKRGYKSYYNENLIDLVNEKCKEELNMFNFNFDGYQGTESLIDISNYKINWNKVL